MSSDAFVRCETNVSWVYAFVVLTTSSRANLFPGPLSNFCLHVVSPWRVSVSLVYLFHLREKVSRCLYLCSSASFCGTILVTLLCSVSSSRRSIIQVYAVSRFLCWTRIVFSIRRSIVSLSQSIVSTDLSVFSPWLSVSFIIISIFSLCVRVTSWSSFCLALAYLLLHFCRVSWCYRLRVTYVILVRLLQSVAHSLARYLSRILLCALFRSYPRVILAMFLATTRYSREFSWHVSRTTLSM